MELRTLQETFAVARLPADAAVPPWVGGKDLIAVVRTRGELSFARTRRCPRTSPKFNAASPPSPWWVTSISLADAGIPILGISTYDTDHILVRRDAAAAAKGALIAAGHIVK